MITISEAKEKFQGVCVPVVTVLQEDGSVDIDGIQCNIQWLIDQGAR
jgi:dihydrodipicolinate synthase/N-acetylneuraminate lyase